jgi:drug/metabolite transporter (DMT)-like permease
VSATPRAAAQAGRWTVLRQVLAWGALILFETLAQVALKEAGESLTTLRFGGAWVLAALHEPSAYAAACGYVGAFLAWMTILDRMPLSRGFPMSSLVTLAIIAASVLVFGETLDGWRLAGIALILAGLALMGNEEA